MILSKEFYNKCCPSYQKVIDKLEKKIAEIQKCNDATKDKKVKLAIYQFSKRHLTPGEYWKHCLKIYKPFDPVHGNFNKLSRDIVKRAYYHLYLNKNWTWRFHWGYYLKLDCFRPSGHCERNLYYPHVYLKFCLREFEQETSK
uniref:Uncharacterized protein n=1 Tax=Panagrolaimus davidi TaxID=227884 RepID=A0A914QVY2_9BILA